MHLVKPHRTQTVSVFTPLQQLPSNRKQRELAVVTLMGPNCIFISKFKDQTESGVVYYLLLSFPSFVRRVFVALRGSFLEVRTETRSLCWTCFSVICLSRCPRLSAPPSTCHCLSVSVGLPVIVFVWGGKKPTRGCLVSISMATRSWPIPEQQHSSRDPQCYGGLSSPIAG